MDGNPEFSVNDALIEIPAPAATNGTAFNVQFGIARPPQQHILLYSSDEWEEFILEYVSALRTKYGVVRRLGGAGDMGIDICACIDPQKLLFGVWDNYQGKHYSGALTPSVVFAEIAKVIWHSYSKHFSAPRRYYFVAPKGCGTTVKPLLLKPAELRSRVMKEWDQKCASAVTQTQKIKLEGDFAEYVRGFDFSIFAELPSTEIMETHRLTAYHAIRFGGGLPERPPVGAAPAYEEDQPSRYVQQLFEAYSEHRNIQIASLSGLDGDEELQQHFHRQREFFYHAECLRNFARDAAPAGTYDALQSEIHAGVSDIAASDHRNGYARMNAVTLGAASLGLTSNALLTVTKIQDRKGMCHQLADENRLRWRKA